MDNKTFIGIFHSEETAIRKIQALKAEGYAVNDIYAVAKDEDNISMVRGRTDVDVQAVSEAEPSWLDRFMAFLSGEEPVRAALTKIGLSDEEIMHYYQDIEKGSILIYVDKEYGTLHDAGSNIIETADPNLGPNPVNPSTDYGNNPPFDTRNLGQNEVASSLDSEPPNTNVTLGTEDDSFLTEEEHIRTEQDISQQASIEEELNEADELQTKDNNPYTNAEEDSRY